MHVHDREKKTQKVGDTLSPSEKLSVFEYFSRRELLVSPALPPHHSTSRHPTNVNPAAPRVRAVQVSLLENAIDQRHSKMSIMVFNVISGPPSLPYSRDLAFFDSQMSDLWVVPTFLIRNSLVTAAGMG